MESMEMVVGWSKKNSGLTKTMTLTLPTIDSLACRMATTNNSNRCFTETRSMQQTSRSKDSCALTFDTTYPEFTINYLKVRLVSLSGESSAIYWKR